MSLYTKRESQFDPIQKIYELKVEFVYNKPHMKNQPILLRKGLEYYRFDKKS